jgi:hypothetical protein
MTDERARIKAIWRPRSIGRYGRAIAAIVGIALIAAYAFVAYVAQTIPPTPVFRGWVMVLVPSSDTSHKVGLSLRARDPGAPGATPSVSLEVLACGEKPFRGMLLLGGDARLRGLTVILPPGGRAQPPRPVNVLHDVGLDENVPLPKTEAVTFTLSRLEGCIRGVGPGALGTPIVFEGDLLARIKHTVAVFGAVGPRQTQSWPTVGQVPWMSPQDLGAFTLPNATGDWIRPNQFEAAVSVGSLTNRAQVEVSRPPVTGATDLRWQSNSAITATARVVDIDSQSQWQTALTAAAIGFGIGGSLLAALLFEVVVRRHRDPEVVVVAAAPSPPRSSEADGKPAAPESERGSAESPPAVEARQAGRVFLAGLGLLIAFLLGARKRRRS